MEGINRKPFQGVTNIVRFNWHFYVLAVVLSLCMLLITCYLPAPLSVMLAAGILLALLGIFISLAVSFYVYDCSNLYSLDWLNSLETEPGADLVNIHAGFDETSSLLSNRYPDAHLSVFDFYDPAKHTEVSIKRARKAWPPYPGTKSVNTSDAFLKPGSADDIFMILAAHEIRDTAERIRFFSMLRQGLKSGGKIIVVEHLRDLANFMAYSIGAFHFHSRKEWEKTFRGAGLAIVKEDKITAFITVFFLGKQ